MHNNIEHLISVELALDVVDKSTNLLGVVDGEVRGGGRDDVHVLVVLGSIYDPLQATEERTTISTHPYSDWSSSRELLRGWDSPESACGADLLCTH